MNQGKVNNMQSRQSESKFDSDIFRKWRGADCFLNGKKAEILDRADNWATVKSETVSAAFSWPVVDRIMNGSKHFES